MVWCRNSIDYNIKVLTFARPPVVVWCRNSIDYNSNYEHRQGIDVVVWCRNSIDYNTNKGYVFSPWLWFGVGIQ